MNIRSSDFEKTNDTQKLSTDCLSKGLLAWTVCNHRNASISTRDLGNGLSMFTRGRQRTYPWSHIIYQNSANFERYHVGFLVGGMTWTQTENNDREKGDKEIQRKIWPKPWTQSRKNTTTKNHGAGHLKYATMPKTIKSAKKEWEKINRERSGTWR